MSGASELNAVLLAKDLGSQNALVWKAAADELQRLSQNKFLFQIADTLTGWHMLVRPGLTSACAWGWWPVDVGGFCYGDVAPYDDPHILVSTERRDDFSIAERALLSYILPVHSMPSLINKTRPDPELSAFERKTLHMMGLRKGLGSRGQIAMLGASRSP